MEDSLNNAARPMKKAFFGLMMISGILLLGAVVMLLWNSILPEVAGFKTISYGQALGLLVLCRILFGGFHFGRRGGYGPPFAKPGFREKFMNMTDEERATFRAQWQERCKKD